MIIYIIQIMNTDADRHDSSFIWMYIYKLWNDTIIYPITYIFTLWEQNKFLQRKFFDCGIKMVEKFFANGLGMSKNVDSKFMSKYYSLMDRHSTYLHSLRLLKRFYDHYCGYWNFFKFWIFDLFFTLLLGFCTELIL